MSITTVHLMKKYASHTESESLFHVLSPAIWVIRFFGLAPYELPGWNDWSHKPWLISLNYFYTLLLIAINSYIVITTLMNFESLDKNEFLFELVGKGQLILNLLTLLMNLVLGIISRKQLVQLWRAILMFDECFEIANPGVMKFWTRGSMIVSFFSWTIASQLGIYAYDESYYRNLSFLFVYLGTYVAVLKFCSLVFIVGQRFSHLSKVVQNYLSQHNRKECSVIVMKIERAHNHLLTTGEKLNDIYSWSLFLFLPNLFLHIISNMYFFVMWLIVDPNSLKNTKAAFCTFSWLVIFYLQQFVIHATCHFAAEEANQMKDVLLHLRRQENQYLKQDVRFEYYMHAFCRSTLHFLNRKFSLSAAGCFKVNLYSLTTTFGALTTYLVILVQLSGSPHKS